jgi:hypothetical protein
MSNQNKLGLVVDVPYLYAAAKSIFGANIDYTTVYKMAGRGGDLTHAYCQLIAMPNQKKFLGALRTTGYRYLALPGDGTTAIWATELAQTILSIAPHVQSLMVAVADDRLAPILEFVEDTWNCKITLIGFADKVGPELRELGYDFIEFTENVLYGNRQHAEEPATGSV